MTKQLSHSAMYNAAAESRGANLALKKKRKKTLRFPLTSVASKSLFFTYSCKFYRQPPVVAVGGVVGGTFFFPSSLDDALWVNANAILGVFQKELSVRSRDVSFCRSIATHPLFHGFNLERWN